MELYHAVLAIRRINLRGFLLWLMSMVRAPPCTQKNFRLDILSKLMQFKSTSRVSGQSLKATDSKSKQPDHQRNNISFLDTLSKHKGIERLDKSVWFCCGVHAHIPRFFHNPSLQFPCNTCKTFLAHINRIFPCLPPHLTIQLSLISVFLVLQPLSRHNSL